MHRDTPETTTEQTAPVRAGNLVHVMRPGDIRLSGHRREPVVGRGNRRDRPVRVVVSAARRRPGSGVADADCGGSRSRAGSAAGGPGQTRMRSRSSRRHAPIQRAAIAFMRGVRMLHSRVRMPALARTASNAAVKFGPRSRIMNLTRSACSPRSMRRLRACWAVHCPVGCRVTPRTRTRRVPCSITARTQAWVPLSRPAVKKSHARIASAWERRNCGQVGPVRRRAGLMPLALRISHTVGAATLTPRSASSPWILRYPHSGFSRASRRIRAWMFRRVAGRPVLPARTWRVPLQNSTHGL